MNDQTWSNLQKHFMDNVKAFIISLGTWEHVSFQQHWGGAPDQNHRYQPQPIGGWSNQSKDQGVEELID